MAVTVAVLVLLACLGVALVPLLLGGGEDEGGEAIDRRDLLERERERVLDEIREVDLDLAMGKITERDHGALRARLEAQAMDTIAALRELEGAKPAPAPGTPAEAKPPADEEPGGPAGEESEGRA